MHPTILTTYMYCSAWALYSLCICCWRLVHAAEPEDCMSMGRSEPGADLWPPNGRFLCGSSPILHNICFLQISPKFLVHYKLEVGELSVQMQASFLWYIVFSLSCVTPGSCQVGVVKLCLGPAKLFYFVGFISYLFHNLDHTEGS